MLLKYKFQINYILRIFKNYILNLKIYDNYLKIELKNYNKLNFILFFLKSHIFFRYTILIDIICIDFIKKKERFELHYVLLSVDYNSRIVISICFNELAIISSIINIYNGSNWMEREIWDMYGIYFSKHNDLRRILTDYGFNGYPLRKDFPLNGYIELRYNENKKYISYETIEFMQNMRLFTFNNLFSKKYVS